MFGFSVRIDPADLRHAATTVDNVRDELLGAKVPPVSGFGPSQGSCQQIIESIGDSLTDLCAALEEMSGALEITAKEFDDTDLSYSKIFGNLYDDSVDEYAQQNSDDEG